MVDLATLHSTYGFVHLVLPGGSEALYCKVSSTHPKVEPVASRILYGQFNHTIRLTQQR
jgi:hypothetical protein